jgi:beta-galactosidase
MAATYTQEIGPVNLAISASSIRACKSYRDTPPNILIADTTKEVSWGATWIATPADGEQPWIEVEWEQPQTLRQIGLRQRLQAAKQVVLSAWVKNKWTPIATVGDGKAPLAINMMIRIDAIAVRKLRFAFIGNVALATLEAYAEITPLAIRVAGDAKGNPLGVVCDSLGLDAKARARVQISGSPRLGDWDTTVRTDSRGMFSVPLPAGLIGAMKISTKVGEETAEIVIESTDLAAPLVPVPADSAEFQLSLEGTWRFATDPAPRFFDLDFDEKDWADINVPSHWVFAGFHCTSGIGGYRKWLEVPESWRDRRIKLGFDGVYSRAEVWVNGIRVGSHEGGATPFVLDITDAIRIGEHNLVALRVEQFTVSSIQLDRMSLYADFHLAGIYRGAHIFSVPSAHLCRFHVDATLDRGYKDGRMKIAIGLSNESNQQLKKAYVRFELRDPSGKLDRVQPAKLDLSASAWERSAAVIDIPVKAPLHWEAEHPNLYTLTAILVVAGKQIEHVIRRIGFRTVEIRGTRMLINGVAAKFAGTCHHDTHPLLGRAVTPEITRQDLELIKGANLNSLRTSHYPPVPYLLDMADEIGLFVEEEAPFCWAGNAVINLLYSPLIIQHTAEMLERDRSHPSVIWWSLYNESEPGIGFYYSRQWLQAQDKSRYHSAGWTFQPVDIETVHNPFTVELIERFEKTCTTPLVADESMGIWQGICNDSEDIWRDPGMRDYWVTPMVELWERILESKVVAGHMIWCWADELFSLPNIGIEWGRTCGSQYLNEIYKLPGLGLTGDAPWGVIDGWRRPKPEWWLCQKVHTPIRIDETKSLALPASGEPIRIPVRNTHFYTDLAELRIEWRLGNETGTAVTALAPQQSGEIEIRPSSPIAPGSVLDLRFVTSQGRVVNHCQLQIGNLSEPAEAPASAPAGEITPLQELYLAYPAQRFLGADFELAFDTVRGTLRRAVAGSCPVFCDTPHLHIVPSTWYRHGAQYPYDIPIPRTWKFESFAWEKADANIKVHIEGGYEHFAGTYDYLIAPDGTIELSYRFTYDGPEFMAKSIGIKLGLPPEFQQLSWQCQAEFSAYPEDHIGRPQGYACAHAEHGAALPPAWSWSLDDTPLGTNDFRSTKRNIIQASLTSAAGPGLTVLSAGKQNVRAGLESDRTILIVTDFYSGTVSDEWAWVGLFGNGRLVKAGEVLEGYIKMKFVK